MDVKVKMCGITNVRDALHAVTAGADLIGINFFAGSKRFVTIGDAKRISDAVGSSVAKVGVFVNSPAEYVASTAAAVGLDAVQLHGDEDDNFIEALRSLGIRRIIKAFRASEALRIEHLVSTTADEVLLDSYSALEHGGTGVEVDITLAAEAAAAVPGVYLAGGLAPDNVAEVVKRARPAAVDACSRLESAPGIKDHRLVEMFIRRAKEA